MICGFESHLVHYPAMKPYVATSFATSYDGSIHRSLGKRINTPRGVGQPGQPACFGYKSSVGSNPAIPTRVHAAPGQKVRGGFKSRRAMRVLVDWMWGSWSARLVWNQEHRRFESCHPDEDTPGPPSLGRSEGGGCNQPSKRGACTTGDLRQAHSVETREGWVRFPGSTLEEVSARSPTWTVGREA